MKKAIVIMCILFCSIAAIAQNINVTGIVTDSKKAPIAGAVIVLEGNDKAYAISDARGRYSISISANTTSPVLVVSCLGYVTKNVRVRESGIIDIILEDDAERLEESVVVGYGSMRRSDLTGSIASVRLNENQASQATSIDKFLQGKAAGVQVVSSSAAPEAGVSVRIRGMSTFSGSTEPLYVVDGVILNTSSSTSLMTQGIEATGSNESTNELMGINPQDIASIEILKDASATAIYGSQGANGVVLITTKSASKDQPSIKLTMGFDMSQRYKKMDVLNFEEWVDFVTTVSPTYNLSVLYSDPINRKGLNVIPMDWQDYTERTAYSQNVYFSVSGRPNKISYWFSLGVNNTQGIIKQTGFQNYTMRLNLDSQITKKIRFGIRTGISYLDANMTQGASAGTLTSASSLMRSMIYTRPFRFMNEDELSEDAIATYFLAGPDRWLNEYQDINMEIRLNPSAFMEYKILPFLTFKSNLGADFRGKDQIKWRSSRINYSATGSIGVKGHINQLYCNWSNMLSFNKKLASHHTISGTLGTEYSSNDGTTQTVEGWSIEQYKAKIASINSAPNTNFSYTNWNNAVMSFYLRAIYNYRDRYVLTTTYRMDGSSKFRGANKWASFPSFAFAWRLSEEPWIKNSIPSISMMKFRLGWGRVGNQAINSYQTIQNWSNTLLPDHTPGNLQQANVGMFPSNISNPDLKWETSEQTNIGLDLGLLKGRFTITADAYLKTTKDLLQFKRIPGASGFNGLWMNYGDIENRGLEFTLETTPVKNRTIEWSLNGNISFNRNRILNIGTAEEGSDIWVAEGKQIRASYFYGNKMGNSSYCISPLNLFIEGYPMGVFYGLKSTGIVQEGESGTPIGKGAQPREPGSINYVDVNGDGYISETDRIIIGDPNPDFTFGFETSLNIKRFTMSMSFNGSYGNDIFNVNKVCDTDIKTTTHNLLSDAFHKAWTPENKEKYYPALGKMEVIDYNSITDRFVEDGSYIRLANVSLTYDVPFKKKSIIKGLSITLNANNPIFWTRYSGFDPDVNSFASVNRMGADMGSYPGARGYNLRLNFTF